MRILISGGGIGGLTLAYWLKQYGMEPVIIEIAPQLRTEGYMIDFFGSGWDVAERMGIITEIKSKHYSIKHLVYKDARGRDVLNIDLTKIIRAMGGKYVSLMRSDLEQILYQRLTGEFEIRFGASIAKLEQCDNKVSVKFIDGQSEDFDLLVGADGIHSNVRQLAFGPESNFEQYLGYYIAAFRMKNRFGLASNFFNYQEPNRDAGVYPLSAKHLATLFVFKSFDLGIMPPEARKQKLIEEYAQSGWIIPELIRDLDDSQPILFDKVSQIVMPRWSQGRVALIGDACACLTLMAGQGASMAMAGAYVLAAELKNHPQDYSRAFENYEAFLKPDILHKQKKARGFVKTFVPGSPWAIRWKRWIMKAALLPPFDRWTAKSFGERSVLQGR